jgi:hypothetical protein
LFVVLESVEEIFRNSSNEGRDARFARFENGFEEIAALSVLMSDFRAGG